MSIEKFEDVYVEELLKAVLAHPDMYCYDVALVPAVVDRMMEAIKRGSYNKDGPAFKNTCKCLGIPYTYKSINEFCGTTKRG